MDMTDWNNVAGVASGVIAVAGAIYGVSRWLRRRGKSDPSPSITHDHRTIYNTHNYAAPKDASGSRTNDLVVGTAVGAVGAAVGAAGGHVAHHLGMKVAERTASPDMTNILLGAGGGEDAGSSLLDIGAVDAAVDAAAGGIDHLVDAGLNVASKISDWT